MEIKIVLTAIISFILGILCGMIEYFHPVMFLFLFDLLDISIKKEIFVAAFLPFAMREKVQSKLFIYQAGETLVPFVLSLLLFLPARFLYSYFWKEAYLIFPPLVLLTLLQMREKLIELAIFSCIGYLAFRFLHDPLFVLMNAFFLEWKGERKEGMEGMFLGILFAFLSHYFPGFTAPSQTFSLFPFLSSLPGFSSSFIVSQYIFAFAYEMETGKQRVAALKGVKGDITSLFLFSFSFLLSFFLSKRIRFSIKIGRFALPLLIFFSYIADDILGVLFFVVSFLLARKIKDAKVFLSSITIPVSLHYLIGIALH